MKLSATYQTSGLKGLEKAIAQLGKQAGFKVINGALRDASKPIVQEARSLAPSKTGQLKKNIKVRTFRGKGHSDSVATLHIGFVRRKAWYGQILERGADAHEIPNKNSRAKGKAKKLSLGADAVYDRVNHPGTKSYPMLTSSFNSRHKDALAILQKRLRERVILEAVKKYGKAA